MYNAEKITIACAIDNNYVQHCAVMLASLFDNNPELTFKVIIINDGIDLNKQRNLGNFIGNKGQEFSFVAVDESVLEKAPVSQHISIATYFRLLIPELVDDSIEKILFLDSDMVICKSIAPLWNIDISKHSHAAVENPRMSPAHKKNLGIDKDSSYFNAGVLLINLRMWRELNVLQKSIDFISQNPEKVTLWDQDALNYVLQKRWLRIESQWNAPTGLFKSWTPEDLGITSDEYNQTRYKPAIVHFTGGGSSKPWHYNCSHPFKEEYYKYLSQTPWCNAKPIGKPNLWTLFKMKTKALIKKTS